MEVVVERLRDRNCSLKPGQILTYLRSLDEILEEFWSNGCTAEWTTPKIPGETPDAPKCKYWGTRDSCKQAARMDFYRGVPTDDFINHMWKNMAVGMPKFFERLEFSIEGDLAQSMEATCGIIFAIVDNLNTVLRKIHTCTLHFYFSNGDIQKQLERSNCRRPCEYDTDWGHFG